MQKRSCDVGSSPRLLHGSMHVSLRRLPAALRREWHSLASIVGCSSLEFPAGCLHPTNRTCGSRRAWPGINERALCVGGWRTVRSGGEVALRWHRTQPSLFTTSILLHRHRAAVIFLVVARVHPSKPNLLTPHSRTPTTNQ